MYINHISIKGMLEKKSAFSEHFNIFTFAISGQCFVFINWMQVGISAHSEINIKLIRTSSLVVDFVNHPESIP